MSYEKATEVMPLPEWSWIPEAVKRWEKLGYEVHGLCGFCQYGLVVSTEKYAGYRCTNFGDCDLAPG